MRIGVDTTVFERFPGYRRGVVVAHGVRNRATDAALEERLRTVETAVRDRFGGGDWRDDPRLTAWVEAWGTLGVGVGSRPPAVIALVKRVVKGGSLPFVNQLVALMNVVSLEQLVPCGGDDLGTVGEEVMLRPAAGDESYRPLGRPDVMEHPDPGEIVLADERGIVLCRTWCWRNSDQTKLTEHTVTVALNLDLMAPAVGPAEGEEATRRLAEDLRLHCGGEVGWHMLTADRPTVDLELPDRAR